MAHIVAASSIFPSVDSIFLYMEGKIYEALLTTQYYSYCTGYIFACCSFLFDFPWWEYLLHMAK